MKKFFNTKTGLLAFLAVLLIGAGIGGNVLELGDGTATNKEIEFKMGLGGSNPKIVSTTTGLQFGNDVDGFQDFGTGGGGSGGINVVSNPNANTNANDWTASGGTFTRTTTAADVAEGSGSFEWDANAASQTLTSDAFTMSENKTLWNRLCTLNFYYKGGDANLTAGVWDGSAYLAQVTLAAATTFLGSGQITFICPSTGTIAVRFASTADAATMQFDSVFLGTTVPLYGAVSTEFKSFSVTSSYVTNTTHTGYYRRDGQFFEATIQADFAGIPDGGAYTFTLPFGLTMDTTYLQATQRDQVGFGTLNDSGVAYEAEVGYNTTTTVRIFNPRSDATYSTSSAVDLDASVAPFQAGAGDTGWFWFRVPISGWAGTSMVFQPTADDLPFATTKIVTPTGSWTTNTTYAGQYTRDFDKMNFHGQIDLTGAPTATQLFIDIPDGLTVDTTKLHGGVVYCGAAYVNDQSVGTNRVIGVTRIKNTGKLEILAGTNGTFGGTLVTATAPFTFAASDAIGFDCHGIPIVEWNGAPTIPPIGVEEAGPTAVGLAGPSVTTNWAGTTACIANCDACSFIDSVYFRIGDLVHFDFSANLDPTAASTNYQCDITIPVTSDFTSANDLYGICGSNGSGINQVGSITAETAGDKLRILLPGAIHTNNIGYRCSGTYRVK